MKRSRHQCCWPQRWKEVFGAKNWDIMLLQCKLTSIAPITLPTGDPIIAGYVLVAKDVILVIEKWTQERATWN